MATATTLSLVIPTRTLNAFVLRAEFQPAGLTVTEVTEEATTVEGGRGEVIQFACEHSLYKEVRANYLQGLEIVQVACSEIEAQTYSVFTSTTPAIGPNGMEGCNQMARMVGKLVDDLEEKFNDYASEAGHW